VQSICDATTLPSLLPHLDAKLSQAVAVAVVMDRLEACKTLAAPLPPAEKYALWEELKLRCTPPTCLVAPRWRATGALQVSSIGGSIGGRRRQLRGQEGLPDLLQRGSRRSKRLLGCGGRVWLHAGVAFKQPPMRPRVAMAGCVRWVAEGETHCYGWVREVGG
jgi:hypothetical protein